MKDYSIGLDIGTSSIGYSIVDDEGKLIRVKGNPGIGVRLYKPAEKAEDRRGFRTSRRRISRARWRRKFLREFFDEHMAAIDSGFFEKLKYYNESPKDVQAHQTSKQLFDYQTNAEYFHKYPTIYHLRWQLMHEHRKFDLREVYLGIAHIIKHRGHFLNESPTSQFVHQQIDYVAFIQLLSQNYQSLLSDESFAFDVAHAQQLKDYLSDRKLRPSDRAKKLQTLFVVPVDKGDLSGSQYKNLKTRNNAIASELGKALSGLIFRCDALLNLHIDKADQPTWKTSIPTLDTFFELHQDDLIEASAYEIVSQVRALYSAAFLTLEMPKGISAKMIEVYDKHQADLVQYKQLEQASGKQLRDQLETLYAQYIHGIDSSHPVSQEAFGDAVKKALKDNPLPVAKAITEQIESGEFMPKPRSKANAMIPHQMQQLELDAIIRNQAPYYKWLADPNPVTAHLEEQPFKLDELVSFRVPYYVGPMVTAKTQHETSGADFSWMKRKQQGTITPWNFETMVDKEASATEFIERMKTTDTYLMGENVLPANSLKYQLFTVFNELNNVRVNGQHLTAPQKSVLIEKYFKRQATVKVDDVIEMLRAEGNIALNADPLVEGLAEIDRFNSSLSAYRDFKRIVGEAVDEAAYQDDLEKIIEWSTLFEDASIFMDKLKEIPWLTDIQRRQLSAKRYRGWGRLSEKLIDGIQDSKGRTILDLLKSTSKNFMQLVTSEDFVEKINEANSLDFTSKDIIDKAYTSPANRKALRQVLAVVAEIKRIMGAAPQYIYIESADGPQRNPSRTMSRETKLLETYEANATLLSDAVFKELRDKIKEKAIFTDKLTLYFAQIGKDLYSGEPIDLNRFANYDIDHIIPQAFVPDDSMDNRVLTSKTINEKRKEDRFAGDEFANMRPEWQHLLQAGVMSRRKFENLTLHQRDFDKRAPGFIARQLVETRQIIKLTQQVLALSMPETTKIIKIKASLSSDFRTTFHFPKNRNANDYHHAFDAYLAAFLGTYLRKQYPQYRNLFEYGQFDVTKSHKNVLRTANFIYALSHHDKMTNHDGVTTWNRESSLMQLEKVYEYKTVRVSQQTFERHGQLHGQTRWKATDAKVNGGKKDRLVAASAKRPVELYGGYSGSEQAYLALARFEQRGNVKFKVIPVMVRDVQKLKRARQGGRTAEATELHQLVQPMFERTGKNGKVIRTPFEIVTTHLPLGSLFKTESNGVLRLVSNTEYRNTVQLWLSRKEQQFLELPKTPTGWRDYHQPSKAELMTLFDEIVIRERKANPLLSLKMDKLAATRDAFEGLAIQDQFEGKVRVKGMITTLNQILAALHANANTEDLKLIGGPSDFGRVFNPSGITLSGPIIVIRQSTTGLISSTETFA